MEKQNKQKKVFLYKTVETIEEANEITDGQIFSLQEVKDMMIYFKAMGIKNSSTTLIFSKGKAFARQAGDHKIFTIVKKEVE